MKNRIVLFASPLLLLLLAAPLRAQSLYFPPILDTTWQTVSPASLGWRQDKLDTLISFLEQKNSKAFIVLKDGKIVVERYFGAFTKDSSWYWASAGKSLFAFLAGIAQQQGKINIEDSIPKYLGYGWSAGTAEQENRVCFRDQLQMTTGFNDRYNNQPSNNCTDPPCLVPIAAPGTRWAYHNGPYTLAHRVLDSATGQTLNSFTQTSLLARTGIGGQWIYGINTYDEVFFSKPRMMARFGLLMQGRGIWNANVILSDTSYFRRMTNTSQSLNLSYGYLWWLNGKASHRLPQSQIVFSGSLVPNAPPDMIAALGKNGQVLNIVPSLGLVIMRMGDAPDSSQEVPTALANQIWEKLNAVFPSSAAEENSSSQKNLTFRLDQNYPNPFNPNTVVGYQLSAVSQVQLKVFDVLGREVTMLVNAKQAAGNYTVNFNAANLSSGVYIYRLQAHSSNVNFVQTKKMLLIK